MTLEDLSTRLREFAAARDWEKFHSPKNLAMAVSVEAAELMEHFQWLTEAQSDALPAEDRQAVAAEVADVLIYLLRLAERLGIDPLEAVWDKMAENERKYPADRARGSARKYTEYETDPHG